MIQIIKCRQLASNVNNKAELEIDHCTRFTIMNQIKHVLVNQIRLRQYVIVWLAKFSVWINIFQSVKKYGKSVTCVWFFAFHTLPVFRILHISLSPRPSCCEHISLSPRPSRREQYYSRYIFIIKSYTKYIIQHENKQTKKPTSSCKRAKYRRSARRQITSLIK